VVAAGKDAVRSLNDIELRAGIDLEDVVVVDGIRLHDADDAAPRIPRREAQWY
jgi:hypothetical protein